MNKAVKVTMKITYLWGQMLKIRKKTTFKILMFKPEIKVLVLKKMIE